MVSIFGSLSKLWRLNDLVPLPAAGVSSFDFMGKPVLAPFQGADVFHHEASQSASGSNPRDSYGMSGAQVITVAVVEDEPGVRKSLARFLDSAEGFKCVATCENTDAALEQLPRIKPDVVLMDINLPGRSGIECTAELRQILPETEIVMLTIEEDSDRVFESMKAGATGYLVKHSSPEAILQAISEVRAGGAPISSLIARKVFAAFRQPSPADAPEITLSDREEQVLKLVAKGFTNKEIAAELGISINTEKTFVRNIYQKLHVRSRAEAVTASHKRRKQ